jgi:hypothetical protein
MDWSAPVLLYCERSDASFWAEPLNAATNAAFLIAAAAAFWRWRSAAGRDLPALALIIIVVAVGLGSFTFHTVATRGASLADVIPIAIFIYGYLLLAVRRFLHFAPGASLAIVVAFAAAAQAIAALAPPRFLNGSVGYLPALAALIAVAAATDGATRRSLVIAALVFSVSLALRTADLSVCGFLPIGTHFLWHVLNAAVLYVLLHAAIEAADRGH